MHYQLEQSDLTLVLALSRGTTLARAAALLAQDTSSVHRALGRLERRLGGHCSSATVGDAAHCQLS